MALKESNGIRDASVDAEEDHVNKTKGPNADNPVYHKGGLSSRGVERAIHDHQCRSFVGVDDDSQLFNVILE
jgi:hypothetical protein